MAALKNDGALVTWDDAGYGGDSSTVDAQLASDVASVAAGGGAMAAWKSFFNSR